MCPNAMSKGMLCSMQVCSRYLKDESNFRFLAFGDASENGITGAPIFLLVPFLGVSSKGFSMSL